MELLPVGYFSKTHGVKGHLVLRDEATFNTEGLAAVFIDGATGKAPYFISEIRETGSGLMLRLEDVDTVEKAKLLIGKAVFVDAKFVEEEEEDFNLIGYELIDKNHGSLGHVSGWSDNGSQDLLSLEYKGREVILPWVEEFVERVDDDEKKIFYNAPEGLIELYLTDEDEGRTNY